VNVEIYTKKTVLLKYLDTDLK